MVSKKKIVLAVITTTALALGVAGTASAHDKGTKRASETAKHTAHDAERAALEALVAKTIGLDATVIKTRLAASESIGAIAGTKKAELIAVLVADHTKRIDAHVTAGKLTAAQATTLKAGLVAHITTEVDSVRGPMGGPGMGGHKGHKGDKGGHGPKGSMTPPATGITTGAAASNKA